MAVDRPVPTLRVHHGETAAPIYVGVNGWSPVVTKSMLGDVRAFQFSSPFRGAARDAVVHRFERSERGCRNVSAGHHHEIKVALVGLETTYRERAVEIHADKMIVENTARSRQHLRQHGIDLWVVGRAYQRLNHGEYS